MANDPIRIGIVGAGANTKLRHIPGFQDIDGVEVVSVCNRSRESGQRVADEFGILKVYDHWTDLVEANDTDAICIGTWPYLHCPVTLASLAVGKHVLTEARMAMNGAEARTMLDASRRRPDLVTQIVPTTLSLPFDRTITDMIAAGYLGDILAVEVRGPGNDFMAKDRRMHWRHDQDLSGYNILNMGIRYEAMIRWVGPAVSVMAMTSINVARRRNAEGLLQTVTVPDHVEVLCRLTSGAQAHLSVSAVTGLARVPETWIFGSEGTLFLESASEGWILRGSKPGDKELTEIKPPADKQGGWRVEEEFINAIRGNELVKHTTFETGVKYMEFSEAVTRSAQSGKAVALPL
jgi:predicted dehydrogenase